MNHAHDNHIAPVIIGSGNDQNLDSIDFAKLLKTFRRTSPWIIITLALGLSVAYIYIRYTKETFQSTSVLQLNVKSEASILGLKPYNDGINNLSKEIELIKSKLFIGKVVEKLGFEIEYFQYGDILFEERYKNSPFKVWFDSINLHMYDRAIDVELLNSNKYRLSYTKGVQVYNETHNFGDTVHTDDIELVITLKNQYIPGKTEEYFFIIHSQSSLVNYIRKNFTVEPLDFNAKTITVSFKDYNKYKSQNILHAIDTLYIYYTKKQKNQANQQKIQFLDEQLGQTENKLSELENYFESFTITNKTTNLDANLSKTIMVLNEIDSQRFNVRQRLQALEKIRADLNNKKDFMLNPADASLFTPEIGEELSKYQLVLEESQVLLSSYNKNTFAYQKKLNELLFLKERISNYLERTITTLQKNLKQLTDKKNQLEREFVTLPSKQTEFSKTERFYSLYEEFYLSLMKSKAEFELAQAGTVTDYFILSPASLPTTPVSPNKLIIYGIGFLVALFISFFIVGFSYLLDNKITSLNELEKLTDVPVLGNIPFFRWEKKYDTRLIIDKLPKSEISEAFRTIRTNLEFLNGSDNKKVITITSTTSGEGKTFVAVNLGGIISYLDNKVIILDLDMRKPKLQKVFYNTETNNGISTILIGKHDVKSCILKTDLPKLDYIPSGPIPPNPSELILSKHFSKMLEDLKSIYDVIIIDTPPVGLVTDGVRALQKATIPIYVMRADYSKKNYLKALNKIIKTQKLSKLTLVLNATKNSGKNIYGYTSSDSHGYYIENENKKQFDIRSIFRKFAK